MILFFFQYGTALVGLIIAVGIFAFSLSRRGALRGGLLTPNRWWVLSGATLAIALIVALRAHTVWPLFTLAWDSEDSFLIHAQISFLAPLILGIAAVISTALPLPTTPAQSAAHLTPRTPLTFTPRRPLRWLIGTTIVTIGLSLWAGFLSSPDENGRFVNYNTSVSSSASAGTSIYGWWFSTPALCILAALLAVTALVPVLVARPALSSDTAGDTTSRTARVRAALFLATGAILLHLSRILTSLYGASSIRSTFTTGDSDSISFGSTFAEIGPLFSWGAWIVAGVGFALWWSVLLSAARPSRHHSAAARVPIAAP
ncbi:MAG: hypothetical protein ACTJHU_01525 [Mycetocola sp.]